MSLGCGVHVKAVPDVLQALPPDAADGSSYTRLTVLEDRVTLAGSGDDLKVSALSPDPALSDLVASKGIRIS